ncbi:MAG TPA: ATP-binding cassette domain-containing protein [Candidatus Dormibacteraeota bacterium]|nr:ATP-binding cassette domain-containing protein [Candidatus Dormibacteraeota bacterium]
MAAPAIRTSGLTKDYGGGQGLFDLELQVSAGESFALVGPEGAGKTTAVRLLMGVIRPTRGSAYIFGLDCAREAVEVKRRVGYAPAATPDFSGMRGGEVVAYLAGLRGGVHRSRVRELAERLDVDLGRAHEAYSGSDRRKLAILLALMHEPDLLILDEPAKDLDADATEELHALLDQARSEGAAIFLASRMGSEIEARCDRVGTLRRGKLSRQLEEQSRKALPP